VGTYVVRREDRHGAIWLELTHDRLIGPIQKNNADWRAKGPERLTSLQDLAIFWDSRGRPDSLLMNQQALRDAERWAREHADELTMLERDFLRASREA